MAVQRAGRPRRRAGVVGADADARAGRPSRPAPPRPAGRRRADRLVRRIAAARPAAAAGAGAGPRGRRHPGGADLAVWRARRGVHRQHAAGRAVHRLAARLRHPAAPHVAARRRAGAVPGRGDVGRRDRGLPRGLHARSASAGARHQPAQDRGRLGRPGDRLRRHGRRARRLAAARLWAPGRGGRRRFARARRTGGRPGRVGHQADRRPEGHRGADSGARRRAGPH